MRVAATQVRVPDFFCIGVQKAGTTWLYENLCLHPAFAMPILKEVDYFNFVYCPDQREWIQPYVQEKFCEHILWLASGEGAEFGGPEERLARIRSVSELALHRIDDDWYSRLFELTPSEGITGDCTPEYSLLPKEGIHHLARLNPEASVILMLRHPVDRDLSHAKMLLKNAPAVTEQMIREAADLPGVYLRSEYPEIIRAWTDEVGPDRLKLAFFDHIGSRPTELLIEIASFLGVQTIASEWPRANDVIHRGQDIEISEDTRRHVRQRHEATIEWMAEHYPEPCAAWRDM